MIQFSSTTTTTTYTSKSHTARPSHHPNTVIIWLHRYSDYVSLLCFLSFLCTHHQFNPQLFPRCSPHTRLKSLEEISLTARGPPIWTGPSSGCCRVTLPPSAQGCHPFSCRIPCLLFWFFPSFVHFILWELLGREYMGVKVLRS